MPRRETFDLDRCYPYLVPEGYLPFQPNDQESLVRPFANGLFIVLVQDQEGLVQNVNPEDLIASNTTAEAAREKASENLDRLLATGKIKATKYEKGPHDRPFIVVGEHWAAAACILLPRVQGFAQRSLGSDRILAFIPHREVMLLFPHSDKDRSNDIQKFVVEHEPEGRKPLTFEPFELTKAGPAPVPKAR